MPSVDLDGDKVGSLVSSVIANLAVDGHRARTRTARNQHKLLHPVPAAPEDLVCERAEARWLWTQRAALPAQDRTVLELRAAGYTLPESAAHLGISYRAAENALGRARRRLKAAWQATAALLAGIWIRRAGRAAGAVAAVPAALTLALALGVLPEGPSWQGGQGAGGPLQLHAVHATLVLPGPSASPALPRSASRPKARPSPAAVAPRPVPRAGEVTLAQTPAVRAGRAKVGPVPVVRRDPDESLLATVRRCLDEGLVVSPTRLGCPPS
jgi:DNA-binding CsgD family transcriptional regulator